MHWSRLVPRAPSLGLAARLACALNRRLTSSSTTVNTGDEDATGRPHASIWCVPLVGVLALSWTFSGATGCGPIVERAPFPARPDSVRSADLLGPFSGKVIDADSERPLAGVTIAASWAFERGIGALGPLDAEEVITQTGVDGRYAIPRLSRLPTGLSARVRRFTLIVYRRGYVGWRSDRRFPGRQPRRDFSQLGNLVRLERWQSTLAHGQHLLFLGGGPKVREVASWEAQQAGLELEGELSGRAAFVPTPAGPALVLDISGLLTDDEIRGVTGYVGRFDDGKLADLPTTEFYDSRHFKAEARAENYDVGVRVWRLGAAAAEVQYQKLQRELPQAAATDEIGDASFRASAGKIQGLVFLVRERGVVVSLTCGDGQCTDKGQIVTLGKLVESRLPDLPAAAPPALTNPAQGTDGAPKLDEDAPASPADREETP
jgi:hypothetical protein